MAISLSESLHIGFTDIMTRKVRSIVTIFGIILGVMSIMVVLAIVNGMNKTTLAWMQERGGVNKIQVRRNWGWDYRKGGKMYFSLDEIKLIRDLIPDVLAFNATVRAYQMPVRKAAVTFTGEVLGVMPDMKIVDEWDVSSGRFINRLDIDMNNNVAVLGSTVASELFASKNPLGEYVNVRGQQLMVVGIMETKFFANQGGGRAFGGENAMEYLNRRTFVPISTMMHKISPNQVIESFEIKTHDSEQAKVLRPLLENIVLNLRQGKEIFSVDSAEEQLAQMKQNSIMFTAIFVMIAVISLLVGGIVIMNIMLASVKERTREIGVRLAIGARRFDIFTQFLVQTVLITTIGGMLGIALGYSLLGVISKYLGISVIASAQMIGIALLVSIGVGLLFGIMPAVRASNLDPVIALREE